MMHYRVLKGLLITSHLLFATNAAAIDGKLDFGESHSSTSALRSENRDNRNTFMPLKYSKTIKTSSDDFEDIGIVCTSGGCNTTQSSSNNHTGDIIQTDVLVHVQTKVDFDHSTKTEPVDDTPDIPIVIGYGGSQLDATMDDDTSHSLGPQSIYVPDVPEIPTYKSTFASSSFGSTFNPPGTLTPSIGSRIDSLGTSFSGLDSSARSDSFYGTNPSLSPSTVSRINTFGGSFDSLNPSVKPGSFYITKSTPLGPRVDAVSRTFEKLDPAAKTGFYPSRTDSDQKENGIEVKIPYFDPTYHNHYYGENPPQQYVWYSKKTNSFNPVEFKTVKTAWMPSVWNRNLVPHSHTTTTGEGGIKCTCTEGRSDSNTGLRWYPNADRGVPSINDPGAQINDKLAPLN